MVHPNVYFISRMTTVFPERGLRAGHNVIGAVDMAGHYG